MKRRKEGNQGGRKRGHAPAGSLTVEATLVMGMVLMVIVVVIHLFFYVHNRCYLTCAAYESALSGSMAAVRGEGGIYLSAFGKSRELAATRFHGAENFTTRTNVNPSVTGQKVLVTYEADTRPGFGMPTLHMKVEGRANVLYPVRWIRTTKAVKDMLFATAQ